MAAAPTTATNTTDTTTTADTDAYLGYYPVGAFVVSNKTSLGPLISHLRQQGRLRSGRNVTDFDTACCDCCCSAVEGKKTTQTTSAQDSSPLHPTSGSRVNAAQPLSSSSSFSTSSSACSSEVTQWLVLFRESPLDHVQPSHAEDTATTTGPHSGEQTGGTAAEALAEWKRVSLYAPAVSQAMTTPSSSPLFTATRTFLRHFRKEVAAPVTESSPTTRMGYTAVHTVGAWTQGELAELLSGRALGLQTTSTSSPTGASASVVLPPLCYVHQLRGYSLACCPLDALPHSVLALRARAIARHRQQHREASASSPAPLEEGGSSCGSKKGQAAPEDSSASFSFAELFGGIGMFRMGLERVGGVADFAVEFAMPAQTVYTANFHCVQPTAQPSGADESAPVASSSSSSALQAAPPLVGDITELPSVFFPPHDVLTAGFPCQSFAKAGPATGLLHSKGWLFYEVVRVLRAARPKAFVLENVENLVSVEGGEQLGEILRRLQHPCSSSSSSATCDGDGDDCPSALPTTPSCESALHTTRDVHYNVCHRVVDGGVVTPQTRRRVYFIGVRTDCPWSTVRSGEESVTTPTAKVQVEGEVERRLNVIFDDALAALTAVGEASPFRCVRDVLLESLPPPGWSTDQVQSHLRTLRLSPSQWAIIRRSKSFRQNPSWRLVDLDGRARTLMGSYRTSYQLYSEFVPYPSSGDTTSLLQSPPLAACTTPPQHDGNESTSDSQVTLTDGRSNSTGELADAFGDVEDGATPALRFYAVRECARLQGIPDTFSFLTDGSDRVEEAFRASRLPSGAAYKLVGNAVNPIVVECLGRSLVRAVDLHAL